MSGIKVEALVAIKDENGWHKTGTVFTSSIGKELIAQGLCKKPSADAPDSTKGTERVESKAPAKKQAK